MISFEEAIRPYQRTIEVFIKYKVNPLADAEDVIQETWLAAYQHYADVKKPESIKSWLLSVASSKIKDHYRRKARRLEIPLEELEETQTVHTAHGPEEITVVRDALERLGEKDKRILYLYYFKDLPQDEIASRLGVPIGTVKSRLHYARKKLRQEYEPERKEES